MQISKVKNDSHLITYCILHFVFPAFIKKMLRVMLIWCQGWPIDPDREA